MIAKPHNVIDIEEFNNSVSELDIWTHYFEIPKIPCFINSPLREDSKPSFGIYKHNGRIYYHDMATSDKGGIYDLLGKLWGLDYTETFNRVYEEIYKESAKYSVSKRKTSSSNIRVRNLSSDSETDIEVKVREWEQHDIEYWRSFGIEVKWLKYADVYPISHKVITKNGKKYVFGAAKYAYAYVEFKEGKVTIKVYQPLVRDKRDKWFNKHDRSVLSLWTKVPEYGERICICSSVKDALCLWSNTGIPCIATQGEGYAISDTAISELKRRYHQIYILFDNDDTGIKDGIILSENTGFIDIILPKFDSGKDISDYYKAVGKDVFVSTMRKLFKL